MHQKEHFQIFPDRLAHCRAIIDSQPISTIHGLSEDEDLVVQDAQIIFDIYRNIVASGWKKIFGPDKKVNGWGNKDPNDLVFSTELFVSDLPPTSKQQEAPKASQADIDSNLAAAVAARKRLSSSTKSTPKGTTPSTNNDKSVSPSSSAKPPSTNPPSLLKLLPLISPLQQREAAFMNQGLLPRPIDGSRWLLSQMHDPLQKYQKLSRTQNLMNVHVEEPNDLQTERFKYQKDTGLAVIERLLLLPTRHEDMRSFYDNLFGNLNPPSPLKRPLSPSPIHLHLHTTPLPLCLDQSPQTLR
ncbi:hypothetical protein D9758_012446 [Tetrapyrgos nigripes]|uniref:Uncharacterized protein n=1 Tax=Tetrapyrgos nigripes TaxID=182062 RepID=A0A8H5D1G3_9AGAR|nr:hypothetical protein D9758_012446 [Tetrapyrgos nigripes]